MKMIAIFICMTGALLLYCSHPHQNLLKLPLNKTFRIIGLGCLLISLIVLLNVVPKLVAVFMWLMTMLVIWTFAPFIRLLKKNITHEISNSTKNPT